MPLGLHNLKPKIRRRVRQRVGRGNASGSGTYSGRGQKGQRARSGGRKGLKRMGFKKTLQNIPKKRGFRSLYAKREVVNIIDLEKFFNAGDSVTPQSLARRGLISTYLHGVKILGTGELSKKLNVSGFFVSASAKQKIAKAGGIIKVES